MLEHKNIKITIEEINVEKIELLDRDYAENSFFAMLKLPS
jgi:hypothetical protein